MTTDAADVVDATLATLGLEDDRHGNDVDEDSDRFEGLEESEDSPSAFQLFKEGADAGDAEAMFRLGDCYEEGIGVDQDSSWAVHWFAQAVKLGHAAAMGRLAICFERGIGVAVKDMTKAIELYEQACNGGDSRSKVNLGVAYEYGHGVAKDAGRAVQLYEEARREGCALGATYLGVCYEEGVGVEKEVGRAVGLYEEAVKEGEVEAMKLLGNCYLYGIGVDVDEGRAKELFEMGVNSGDDSAIGELGLCYHFGRGVERDDDKAYALMRLAVERGEDAKNMLGMCFEEGVGVEKDDVEAARLFAESVEEFDNRQGMVNLGVCYEEGRGVGRDEKKAVGLFERARRLGHEGAGLKMGRCYEEGRGVTRDLRRAKEMYEEAARAGDREAMQTLGVWHEEGRDGVAERDVRQAEYWYRRVLDVEEDVEELYAMGQFLDERLRGRGGEDGEDEMRDMMGRTMEALYSRAMELGDVMSCVNLGYCYANGYGVCKDEGLAASHYELAIDRGSNLARNNLAEFYENGFRPSAEEKRLTRDPTRAQLLYRDALRAGRSAHSRRQRRPCGPQPTFPKSTKKRSKNKQIR